VSLDRHGWRQRNRFIPFYPLVYTRFTGLSACRTIGLASPATGNQRHNQRLQKFEFSNDSVAPGVLSCTAAGMPDGKLSQPDG
jgi:hypothetical protein